MISGLWMATPTWYLFLVSSLGFFLASPLGAWPWVALTQPAFGEAAHATQTGALA